MKTLVLLLVTTLATPAFAKTFCTLNRENPTTPHQYDQTLLTGELDPKLAFVLKKDGVPTQTKNLESLFADPAAVAALADARIVFVSAEPEGSVTIVFARFDASAESNLLPSDFVSSGPLGPRPVLAIDSKAQLAVSCFRDEPAPAPAEAKP